jgi:hypothetical protein
MMLVGKALDCIAQILAGRKPRGDGAERERFGGLQRLIPERP